MSGALRIPLLAVLTSVWSVVAPAAERLCETIVGVLATEFVYRVPNARLARVEMRQCSPATSATIQIAAWRSGDTAPSLLVDTSDFGVVQASARANVFVVETGGATRNQVFVIVYSRGQPRLALRRTTRGTARIGVSDTAIDLVIEGIYAGDGPPRTESQHFALSLDEMKPR